MRAKKVTNKGFIPPIIAAIAIIAVVVLVGTQLGPFGNDGTNPTITPEKLKPFTGKTIPRFSSENDVRGAFTELKESGNSFFGRGSVAPTMANGGAVGESKSQDSVSSPTPGGPDYSTTNNQVQGVDEADIVKTDGEYIYAFYKNKLVITKAYPAVDARVVKSVSLENVTPQQMLVNGNKLVLFGNKYHNYEYPCGYGPCPMPAVREGSSASGTTEGVAIETDAKMAVMPTEPYIYPPYWNYPETMVMIYDISNKENPKLEKEFAFKGNYSASRMIGSNVYFVMSTYPDYQILAQEKGKESGSIIPTYKEDGVEKKLAEPQQVGYIPPMYAQNFVTLAGYNLDSKTLSKETIVGNAETVYASEDSMYVAYNHYQYYGRPMPFIGVAVRAATDAGGVIVGESPVDEDKTDDSDTSVNDASDDPKDEPTKDDQPVKDTVIAPEPEVLDEQSTIINKFDLENGKVSFNAQGIVPGRMLNQFSMDEFEGDLRVATTIDGQWSMDNQNPQPTNNVFVLNAEMKTVGELEDLAPGERIYSARFMGERGYLVTFRQIDPLFVIDLSDSSNPKVLGKLKIPGYSDYLHPIDDTHLIGVGKDTQASKSSDAAWYLGMKLAIFDVSDVSNPKQIHSLIIGDRGTDSFALQDHKAFLYDQEKNLLVLPIYLHEINEDQQNQIDKRIGNWEEWPAYGEPVYQGAFVYNVTLENGFVERGRITHIDGELDLKSGYYLDWQYQIQRSLFIGNVLYTISSKMIKANDLSDLSEIKAIPFIPVQKNLVIKSRIEGVFCAGACGYTEVEISKTKIRQTTFSGGDPGYTNSYENPAYSQYDDIVENLDWATFKQLDDTYGCPGCADGSVETITITDGTTTKSIRLEAGMEVDEIQDFLTALRNYTGGYGYYGGGVIAVDTVAPPSTSADPMPI